MFLKIKIEIRGQCRYAVCGFRVEPWFIETGVVVQTWTLFIVTSVRPWRLNVTSGTTPKREAHIKSHQPIAVDYIAGVCIQVDKDETFPVAFTTLLRSRHVNSANPTAMMGTANDNG